jgi:fluoride exporter
MIYLLIGLGGSLGACTRFLLGSFVNEKGKRLSPFPIGTWIINISGSFILGVMAHLYQNGIMSEWVWYFGGIGFCGAYTTFSTFGYEVISLIHRNKPGLAFLYIASSVILGIVSSAIGYIIFNA